MSPCIESTRTPSQERPHITVNGRSITYSRYLWERVGGPIPDGLFLCHHCDNPRCIALDHLFLGTAYDNNQDMVRKGRHRWGSHNSYKTECVHGHPLSGDNLYVQASTGKRYCRECARRRTREHYYRGKQA